MLEGTSPEWHRATYQQQRGRELGKAEHLEEAADVPYCDEVRSAKGHGEQAPAGFSIL